MDKISDGKLTTIKVFVIYNLFENDLEIIIFELMSIFNIYILIAKLVRFDWGDVIRNLTIDSIFAQFKDSDSD